MTKVFLALGSNVGDKRGDIERAIELLQAKISNIKQAPIYKTKPVGFIEQDNFMNTAIVGETKLKPLELLEFIKEIEAKVGRIERFRWGPREIDIDIIFYGDEILEGKDLTIPHPRFSERDFVLIPLCDLAPDFVDPKTIQTIRQLLDKIPPTDRSIIRGAET